MSRFDALIFDIDNTLFDEQTYFEQAFEIIAQEVASETGIDEATVFQRILAEFEKKGSQYDKFFLHIADLFDLDESYHDVFYNQYLEVDVELELYDDAREIINWATNNGYALGLLTSGSIKAQRNKIETLSLEQLFDVVCVPRELGDGYEKPAPDAYRWVLDTIAVQPDRSIYIGDNPSLDFQGAKKLGMTTVRLRRGEFSDCETNESLIDHEITTHDQLIELLQ
jgi:putative hydrolase of the HAD superfamily